jgi:hypothetical protein
MATAVPANTPGNAWTRRLPLCWIRPLPAPVRPNDLPRRLIWMVAWPDHAA